MLRVTIALVITVATAHADDVKWANGAPAESTHRTNGVPDGDSTRWYPDGTVAVRAHYTAGVLDGPFEEHDVHGNITRSGRYVAGAEDGDWIENAIGGKPWLKGHYDHGLRTGVWLFFDNAGKAVPDVAATDVVKDNWWKATTPCPGGAELGEQDVDEQMCKTDSQPHGPATKWFNSELSDEGGHITGHRVTHASEQGNYRFGRRHGPWTFWFPNGHKRMQGSFVDGYPTGPWNVWSAGGKLSTVTLDASHGWISSIDPEFWKHGACPAGATLVGKPMKSMACELPAGVPYGPSIDWNDDGSIFSLTVHVFDAIDGPSQESDGSGWRRFTEKTGAWTHRGADGVDAYYIDNRQNHRVATFKHGQLVTEESYADGWRQFDSTTWSNGAIAKVERYVRGSKVETIEYKDGKPVPKPAPVVRPIRQASAWWKRLTPCPPGATIVGRIEPSGEMFCAKADGTLHGPYTKWWAQGGVADEGAFVDGRADGPWHLYYPDGLPLEDSTWQRGLRVGHFIEHGVQGSVTREGDFVDGLPDGPWTYADETGRIEQHGRYERGLRAAGWSYGTYGDVPLDLPADGWEKQKDPCPPGLYFSGPNAETACQIGVFYHGPFHRRDTLAGPIRERGHFRFNQRHGRWAFFHANGKRASEGNYIDGIRDGDWTFWDPKGNLIATIKLDAHAPFPVDSPHGEWWKTPATSCPTGTKVTGSVKSGRIVCAYPDGFEHGPVTTFEDGVAATEGVVRDGKRWGFVRSLDPKYVWDESWYFLDQKDGTSRVIESVDHPIVEERFRIGMRSGRTSRWNKGAVTEGITISDRYKRGPWTTVDRTGELERIEYYDTSIDAVRTVPYEHGKPIVK